jgi:hypothetical protein
LALEENESEKDVETPEKTGFEMEEKEATTNEHEWTRMRGRAGEVAEREKCSGVAGDYLSTDSRVDEWKAVQVSCNEGLTCGFGICVICHKLSLTCHQQ